MESFKIVNECHARFLGRFLDDRRLLAPVAAVVILVVAALASISLLPKRHVENFDLLHFNINSLSKFNMGFLQLNLYNIWHVANVYTMNSHVDVHIQKMPGR